MGRRSMSSLVEEAKKHGLLHLIQYQLVCVPPELFSSASSASSSSASSTDLVATLTRLNLSFNQLEGPQALPDTIGSLVALRELYINNNPRLKQLPAALVRCTKLQVLDASASALELLPQELGRLQHLRLINIDDTPLQRRWEAKGHLSRSNEDDGPLFFTLDTSGNNTKTSATTISSTAKTDLSTCQQILRKLRRKDEREQLKQELFGLLRDKVYRLERHDDSAAASAVLYTALRRVLKLFPQAIDIRSLLRNAERLFPREFSIKTFKNLDATRIRHDFDVLRTAIERKKRAADLELKIRNLYFDRIDPTTVEGMVHQIYAHLPELSDIKFLIAHASRLFPKEARDVDGEQIQRDLVALQQQFAHERAAAVDKLLVAVKTLYSDTEPDSVLGLVSSVAALFKNTKELLSLAADVSVLFPADFLNAQPTEVRAGFLRMKAEVMGGSGPISG